MSEGPALLIELGQARRALAATSAALPARCYAQRTALDAAAVALGELAAALGLAGGKAEDRRDPGEILAPDVAAERAVAVGRQASDAVRPPTRARVRRAAVALAALTRHAEQARALAIRRAGGRPAPRAHPGQLLLFPSPRRAG
jgi:hypothetical protein